MKLAFISMLIISFSAFAKPNTEIVLSVPEMTCPSCAASIGKHLGKLKGIKEFDIVISSKTVSVTLTRNSTITRKELKDAINAAGFEVKE